MTHRVTRWFRQFVVVAALSLMWGQWPLMPQEPAKAAAVNMMLFWDGAGAPPAPWTVVTTFDGRFPRGESVANYGLTGGAATHTLAVTSTTLGPPSATLADGGGLLTTRSTAGHTHGTLTTTADPANNLPAFRSLKLIRADGFPNVIPVGAIAMFDGTPGVPAGWTRVTAQDNLMIRVNNTVATGGADTHTHNLNWPALGSASGNTSNTTNGGNVNATNAHTHTAPVDSPSSSATSLPPYVQPLLAKADADTTFIPEGIIVMTDGNPGAGWSIQSNSGGRFFQQFLRPSATFNGSSIGSSTHTHAATASGPSGASDAASGANSAGTAMARNAHTHILTANFSATAVNHTPQYFNVVIAEKISFTQSNYRWYADSNAQDVTDAWGRSNVAQNTALTAIPAQNDPPVPTNELRLRMNLTVGGDPLPAASMQFRLQYKQGTDGSCTTGTWTDVGAGGSGSIWRFATSTPTDGTNLTASRLSPTSSVLQDYVKSNPTVTNANAATVGQTIEYDFHIEHNNATDASQYSFRLIENSGILFPAYTVCPTLVTAPGTTNLLRGGQFWQDQTRSTGYYWAN